MTGNEITLGSLFDGIGGFPFCAQIMGARPVWAAEINPFGVAVTHHRFPDMLHFGDVSKISRSALPPVDIITFGSPCQDLSVAGKRAGLDGERSGLFRDAIRIVYEMREETNGRYPTYIVWENVPGAFSSHNGRDFQEVLREITKADIPMPESGRWADAGMVRGGEVCVAWRVLDAQFWGVPQRRKRIYLIGSFGNNSAGEILFKRDSVRRYLTPRGKEGQTSAGDSGICPAPRDRTKCLTPWDCQSKRIYKPDGVYPTLQAMGNGGANNTGVLTFDTRGNGDGRTVSPIVGDHNNRVTDYTSLLVYNNNSFGGFAEGVGTIRRCEGKQPFNIILSAAFSYKNGERAQSVGYAEECAPTIRAETQQAVLIGESHGFSGQDSITAGTVEMHKDQVPGVVHALQGSMVGREEKNGPQGDGINKDICFTLNTTDRNAVAYGVNCRNFYTYKELYSTLQAKENGGQSLNFSGAVLCKHIDWTVRRLTPLECERLQGYPDGWTELPKIKKMTDEEYALFLRVWQTDRKIRGVSYKTLPDKKKLVKWYNRLESDTSRYQALGNSLAIPCALRVIGGIVDYMKETCK